MKLKRSSSIGSQSSAKTVKTSNYGHRRRVRPLPGMFPTIPADQPLSAPSPSEHTIPEEAPRKAPSKRDIFMSTNGENNLQTSSSTRNASNNSSRTNFQNLKRQNGDYIKISRSNTVQSKEPMELGDAPDDTRDFQPHLHQLERWQDTTHCEDEETSMDPESFHGEDIDSTESTKINPMRKRALWYAFCIFFVSICFLMAIIFHPRSNPKSSTSMPTPTPAPSAQAVDPTMAPPSSKEISGVSDAKDSDYQMPVPPREDLDNVQAVVAPSSSPELNPNQDLLVQVGSTVKGDASSFSFAAAGSILSVGGQVYHLLGDQWYPMGKEFPFSSISQVILSENGVRLVVVSEGNVAVYAFDGLGRWDMVGDMISTYDPALPPLVDISSNGDIICIARSNGSSSTGMVQAYRFMSGRWKEHGATIEEDLEQGYFTMDLSRDGDTIALGSWEMDQKVQVYHLGPTKKWEMIGQVLQKSHFFRRSTLASKIAVSLGDDGLTLAFTSASVTDVLVYVDEFNEWVKMSPGLAGGTSVTMSNYALVVGNPTTGGSGVVYSFLEGEWVENPLHFPRFESTTTAVQISGNHVAVASTDTNDANDAIIKIFDLMNG